MHDIPLRLGIVGFGRLAQNYYVPALGKLAPAGQIVAVADPAPACRSAAESVFPGISTFSTHGELLETCQLDGLLVASPPSKHLKCWLDAAACGLPVFMEKPFVVNNEIGRADLGREVNSRLMINFNRRFWPAYRQIAEKVRSGGMGRVVSAEFVLQVNVEAWCSVTQHRLMAGEGGALFDLGSQVLDLVSFVFGDDPIALAAKASSKRWDADHIEITIEYAEGMKVLCRVAYDTQTRESINILCESGQIRIDNPNFSLHCGRENILVGKLRDLASFGSKAFLRDQSMSRYTIRGAIGAFIDSICKGEPFSPGFNEAARSIHWLEAALKSAASGVAVDLQAMEAGIAV